MLIMYQEKYILYKSNTLYQLQRITNKEVLLVFFHGLGDSSLSYRKFFFRDELKNYDIFISDLIGHGKSSSTEDYSFINQCNALSFQLNMIINQYNKVIFIPHSMGGIHATILAKSYYNCISGIFAIESSITEYGSFIAKEVNKVTNSSKNFVKWFNTFLANIYLQILSDKKNILQDYYASLHYVRLKAFQENAIEMYDLANSINTKEFKNIIGYDFSNLNIPKAYCLGKNGNQIKSIPFLKVNKIAINFFPTNSHWVAQACPKEFCKKLVEFINETKKINSE